MHLRYESSDHRCDAVPGLLRGDGGIQANQVRIRHGEPPALLDPQHGRPLCGAAIGALLEWLGQLRGGIDLPGREHFRLAG